MERQANSARRENSPWTTVELRAPCNTSKSIEEPILTHHEPERASQRLWQKTLTPSSHVRKLTGPIQAGPEDANKFQHEKRICDKLFRHQRPQGLGNHRDGLKSAGERLKKRKAFEKTKGFEKTILPVFPRTFKSEISKSSFTEKTWAQTEESFSFAASVFPATIKTKVWAEATEKCQRP